jgi:uncharacterized OB-fold protein
MDEAMANQIPVVDYLVLDDPPFLRARVCVECEALYFDRRNACARCGTQKFGRRDLARTGKVRAFTVVRRASSKLPTPYVSAIVDLDGGGTVKANLIDMPEPAAITPEMPVRMTTWVAGTDDDGTEAVAFGFTADGVEA